MPLDVAGFTVPVQTVEQIAHDTGITSVPRELLDAHKAEQLMKHPGSWDGRHRDVLRAIFLGCFGLLFATLVTCLLVPATSDVLVVAPPFVASLFVLCILCLNRVVTLPAEWQETVGITLDDDVPEPIRALALTLRQDVPGASFIVGRLIQNKVVLDPYLIVESSLCEGQVIVGIWEDDQIIAIAKQD